MARIILYNQTFLGMAIKMVTLLVMGNTVIIKVYLSLYKILLYPLL